MGMIGEVGVYSLYGEMIRRGRRGTWYGEMMGRIGVGIAMPLTVKGEPPSLSLSSSSVMVIGVTIGMVGEVGVYSLYGEMMGRIGVGTGMSVDVSVVLAGMTS